MDIVAEKYINPFTDFGFKKLFGTEENKDLLMDFLNELIRGKGKIIELKYLNAEQLGRTEYDRRAVYDIYCETDTGEKLIVENSFFSCVHQFYFRVVIIFIVFTFVEHKIQNTYHVNSL